MRGALREQIYENRAAFHRMREMYEARIKELLDPVVKAKMLEPTAPIVIPCCCDELRAQRDELLAACKGLYRFAIANEEDPEWDGDFFGAMARAIDVACGVITKAEGRE